MTIRVPMYIEGSRQLEQLHVRLLHEVLSDMFVMYKREILASLETLSTLNWKRNSIREDGERNGDLVVPYGVFIDAACWRGQSTGVRIAC